MKSNLASLMMVLVAALVCASESAMAFYDPGLQRWVNRDPIQERGGINLFRYVGNVPTRKTDPWGLRLIIVPGGPLGFPYCVASAQGRLSDTRLGQYLNDQLVDTDVLITASDTTDTQIEDSPEIRLAADDPNFIPHGFYERHTNEVPKVGPTDPWAGRAVVLGHELGHALLRLPDPRNVLEIENPIRESLGLALRPRYHDTLLESDKAPSCPCFDPN